MFKKSISFCVLASLVAMGSAAWAEEDLQLRQLDGKREVQVQAAESSNFAPAKLSDAKVKEIAKRIDRILSEKVMKSVDAGILVTDLETGQRIYARQANKALKPASNMKLLTTAAALGILGPDAQFESAVYMDGSLDKNGTLKGDLHLKIDHDFTWSTSFYDTADYPMTVLTQKILDHGIRKIEGRIIVSGRVVYGGTPTGTLNCVSHLRSAANRFVTLLRNKKITGGKLVIETFEPAAGHKIASWLSPTLSEALVPVNRVSHNEYADLLLMLMGSRVEKRSQFEAGAIAIHKWLKEIGLDDSSVKIVDGSGLSHDNRLSAEFLVALTEYMVHSPYAASWAASLSVAGYDGTYGGRLSTTETGGRVLVKSGTLRDVISGSGFLVHAYDGRIYAFALLGNHVRNKRATRQALDRIVRAFAGDNHEKGRPEMVQLESLKADPSGGVWAKWKETKGAKGYRVWVSEDGQNNFVPLEKAVNEPRYYFDAGDKPLYVRITAFNEHGVESNPSLVMAYRQDAQMVTLVKAANCQWDERSRPINRFFSHSLPIAAGLPKGFGIQTVGPASLPEKNDVIFWHGGVCQNRSDLQSEALLAAWNSESAMLVDYFDKHQLAPTNPKCEPTKGALEGCFKESLILKDRRIDSCGENRRLKKATGTGTTRPTLVTPWEGAQSCLSIKDQCLAACHHEQRRALIGFDMGALDSPTTQALALEKLFLAAGILTRPIGENLAD